MNKTLKYIVLLTFACFVGQGYAQELKSEVFSLLNLDYPGLEKVKALHQEGKDEDAAKALLDYYRARTNVKTPDINLKKITIGKEEQQWADDGLKHTFFVQFKDFTVTSRMYEISVTGYENRTNKLELFDIDTVDENIVGDGIDFDKNDIAKNLTLFLYPDDSDEAGRKLRIYQQYFMVSNGARLIIDECKAKGSNLYDLYDYAVIQINDTHPTMVIPELIRLLVQEGMSIDDAINVVKKTCAYTNHTILSEASEKMKVKMAVLFCV